MSTASAPIEIGRVALTVNDLAAVRSFYERAIGLATLSQDGAGATLGAGGRALIELRADPHARRAAPQEAGLFHTAFLLPSRAALGRWLRHAVTAGLRIEGASDHLVSEAVYLSDPEGNGIEVYADRPRDVWPRANDRIRMATEPLDADAVLRAADGPWTGAPDGTVIGHVHLRVGDLDRAESFYGGILGFDVTTRYPGAVFLGAGGYHHHVGANVWASRGAGPRALPSTGLAELEILADGTALPAILARTEGADRLADPWGTPVALRARP
ncbi:putative ring-cleavage extradiol dioxygenase [Rubellimicrobium thermophilum DSM 16684]|uniref:Putative ring-cleavage extradiol dioxygenase n=1 Tax=Rubellimicrobium thermophilum DSM 16684 TaxID=1123069 RepID=S9QXZ0_9RHOB|nr:VOC family protein [Rubellimicrobium thermophilum]EPX86241.1 putative ring-cleavage extradiol dioxygenase [Rubellimicrobium thermophilum DSM 16684]